MQRIAGDVRETSQIVNVRIYVEQAIGQLKQFHILKNILLRNYLPCTNCVCTNLLPGSTVCLNNCAYSVVYPVVNVNKKKFVLRHTLTFHKINLNYNTQSSISINNIMSLASSSKTKIMPSPLTVSK